MNISSPCAPRPANGEVALECRNVSVRYGDIVALDRIDIRFRAGGIHAVLGQNGAGKTTFSSVCAGILRPTTGEVLVSGTPLRAGSVDASRSAGIELVHQSFALPPSFTVAQALEFGAAGRGKLFSQRTLNSRWSEHLSRLELDIDINARIGELPVETRQSVEIARALAAKPQVLILDEPTAVLSPEAANALFARLRMLQAQNVTIILILHKIREVMAVAETVSVLRGGHLIQAPTPIVETSADALVMAIIGSRSASAERLDVLETEPRDKLKTLSHAPAVELHDVNASAATRSRSLKSITMSIRRGEIVGIAGVEGNGQDTLVEAIAGLIPVQQGVVKLADRDVTRDTLARRRGLGLRIIPFDRNREGLSLASSLWENWSASKLVQGPLLALLRPSRLQTAARQSFTRWGVRFASTSQRARELSGGNAQKVILAREIDPAAMLVIAAQPTRGLDVGASGLVWDALRASRASGSGVMLISSDLDELFDICDRLIVMVCGEAAAEFTPPYDLEKVGASMTDARQAEVL